MFGLTKAVHGKEFVPYHPYFTLISLTLLGRLGAM